MIRKFALLCLVAVPALCAGASAPADTGVRIVVPARDIARGETISEMRSHLRHGAGQRP